MAGESYAIPPKDRAVEGILWYIQHHQLAGGDRLPAERVLCEEIGVSRTALRAGIMRLISCGTLESRRGSGTYLCPPKPLNIFQETYNFSDAVRTAGLHPSSRLVSTGTIEADEALADKLGVSVGATRSTYRGRAGVNRDGSRQPVPVPVASQSRLYARKPVRCFASRRRRARGAWV